jgi:hypothetical protein
MAANQLRMNPTNKANSAQAEERFYEGEHDRWPYTAGAGFFFGSGFLIGMIRTRARRLLNE